MSDHHPARPTPRDALFHQPGYRNPEWLETNWFSFLVPERNLRASIYAGFRTNLGVVFSHVTIWNEHCASVLDVAHRDARVHLPMPPGNLDRYDLANGLSVTMTDPGQRWLVRYSDGADVSFDLEITGIMRPVSSHEMLVADDGVDFSHFHSVGSLWKAEIGHIDQTMHIQGELILHGERIAVDCFSNFDHSWAPRPERAHGRGNFDEGFFSRDFAFHVMTREFDDSGSHVTNGYILDHGEPHAIKRGTGRYERTGWTIDNLVYELEDVRGKHYRFEGEATATLPIPSWPNQYNIASLVRWSHEGETGWGDYKWHWEASEMRKQQAAK
jgi:hypothetical protein